MPYTLRQFGHCARLYDCNGNFVSRQEYVFGTNAVFAMIDAAHDAYRVGRKSTRYTVAFEYFVRE